MSSKLGIISQVVSINQSATWTLNLGDLSAGGVGGNTLTDSTGGPALLQFDCSDLSGTSNNCNINVEKDSGSNDFVIWDTTSGDFSAATTYGTGEDVSIYSVNIGNDTVSGDIVIRDVNDGNRLIATVTVNLT